MKAKETLQQAVTVSGWKKAKPGPYIGRGVAIIQKHPGVNATGATLIIDRSARVIVKTGIPEQGSGSHTILEQIVAEELQIPHEFITVEVGSTDDLPNSGMGSGASSVSHLMGQAVLSAARQLRTQLIADLAVQLKVQENDVSFKAGVSWLFSFAKENADQIP